MLSTSKVQVASRSGAGGIRESRLRPQRVGKCQKRTPRRCADAGYCVCSDPAPPSIGVPACDGCQHVFRCAADAGFVLIAGIRAKAGAYDARSSDINRDRVSNRCQNSIEDSSGRSPRNKSVLTRAKANGIVNREATFSTVHSKVFPRKEIESDHMICLRVGCWPTILLRRRVTPISAHVAISEPLKVTYPTFNLFDLSLTSGQDFLFFGIFTSRTLDARIDEK
ncbi:hypothetical protein EVAR_20110_1 [Eumeta japonica]|uniref:Uncharacterized protein n=1 Tax=Eumeta variegata TaxID=151549 RepID=A0A4C1V2A6_EUMVA|nr:hypothetical protein EVAR_20110_1 [Eumeta japonica]